MCYRAIHILAENSNISPAVWNKWINLFARFVFLRFPSHSSLARFALALCANANESTTHLLGPFVVRSHVYAVRVFYEIKITTEMIKVCAHGHGCLCSAEVHPTTHAMCLCIAALPDRWSISIRVGRFFFVTILDVPHFGFELKLNRLYCGFPTKNRWYFPNCKR